MPIIVAINKIDKHEADPQKVRTQLLQHEVFVESMGGEVLDVEVSAKTGAGLDKLLEAILLQAELLDLKANPDRTAEGVVIEAKLDKGRGPVATVLVQTGTLMPGDIIVAGDEWGRVRAVVNDRGEQLRKRRRRCRSRFSACKARRWQATASPSSRTKRAPAKSPSIVSGWPATRRWPSMPASAARSSR